MPGKLNVILIWNRNRRVLKIITPSLTKWKIQNLKFNKFKARSETFKDKFKDEEYDPILSSLFKVEDNMEDEGDDEDDVDGEGGDDVEGQGGATVG